MASIREQRGDSPQSKKQLILTQSGQLSTHQAVNDPEPTTDQVKISLQEIAKKMRHCVPGLLLTRPDAEPRGYLYRDGEAPVLDPRHCPNLARTKVRVVNADTIGATIELANNSTTLMPVCVLNMANAQLPGGGWMRGALAQEEALCYRTSLAFSLKRYYYPLPEREGIYSPRILVFRESIKNGHDWVDLRNPKGLSVAAVVSVGAVCRPAIIRDANGNERYVSSKDRALMEEKMRVILRMAARNRHRQIVLGAFGAGAFKNPKDEVAKMWKNVLLETEFAGG